MEDQTRNSEKKIQKYPKDLMKFTMAFSKAESRKLQLEIGQKLEKRILEEEPRVIIVPQNFEDDESKFEDMEEEED